MPSSSADDANAGAAPRAIIEAVTVASAKAPTRVAFKQDGFAERAMMFFMMSCLTFLCQAGEKMPEQTRWPVLAVCFHRREATSSG